MKTKRDAKTQGATPGPWEFVKYKGQWLIDSVQKVGSMAVVNGGRDRLATANARLIAAAPEMLDALLNIKSNLTGRDCMPERIADALRRACDAIAKAEGKSND